jgi:hypothetical protein
MAMSAASACVVGRLDQGDDVEGGGPRHAPSRRALNSRRMVVAAIQYREGLPFA